MRRSRGPEHKALVSLGGVSMLDWNLSLVASHDVRDVVVVTAAGETELEKAVACAAQRLESSGVQVGHYSERTPLGNIGAVGALVSDDRTDLLVLYVDNLCPLDLSALIDHHRATGAAMTLATHVWNLQNPFGELTLADGFVRDYDEKPIRAVRISSGTCVLTGRAARMVPSGSPCSAKDLVTRLIGAAQPVAAFQHDTPWVDLNDANALLEAEELLSARPGIFGP